METRQHKGRYLLARDGPVIHRSEGFLDERLDLLSRQLSSLGDGDSDQHTARQAQFALHGDDPRCLFRAIHTTVHSQPALARVESRKLVSAIAQHRDAVRLQPFQGQRQVKQRLRPGRHHGHRRLRQHGQVGRDINGLASVHTADPASGKDADASAMGGPGRRGHRRPTVEP